MSSTDRHKDDKGRMQEIISAIRSLVERLKATPLDEQSIEGQALPLINRLEGAVAANNVASMARHHDRLHVFWTQRVPWCSCLSKDLEKLLIQMEEYLQELQR